MILIKVEGVVLDIPAKAKITWTRTNNLIKERAQGVRSTTITLPATANNLRVFGFQTNLQLYDDGTLLRCGGSALPADVSIDGIRVAGSFVYLLSATMTSLSVCVVFGDNFNILQAFKDTTIKQLAQGNDAVVTTTSTGAMEYESNSEIWSLIEYQNDGSADGVSLHLPAINLLKVLSFYFTIDYSEFPDADKVWVLPETLTGAKDLPFLVTQTNTGTTISCALGNSITERIFRVISGSLFWGTNDYPMGSPALPTITNTACTVFALRRGVESATLTFDAIPDDVFLIRIKGTTNIQDFAIIQEFLGDYSFDTDAKNEDPANTVRQVYGLPLRGKKITIKAKNEDGDDNWFAFINKSAYFANYWSQTIGGVTYWRERYGYAINNITESVRFSGVGSVEFDSIAMLQGGGALYLADNLPAWKIPDVLQMYCELFGLYIECTGTTIKLRVKDWDASLSSDLKNDKLLNVAKVERRFLDYEQHNLVRFDDANSVPEAWQTSQDYPLAVDVLKQTREIYVAPINEGSIRVVGGVDVYYRRDIVSYLNTDGERVFENVADGWSGFFKPANAAPVRISLRRDVVRAHLCEKCKQVEVRFICSFFTMLRIPERGYVHVHGVPFLWSELRWSEGVVTCILHAF